MQPFTKDMIILGLTQTGIVFNMIWGLLLPYYSSFVHSENKDITIKKMFSTYITFALGQLLASKVMGIKIGFLIMALLNIFNTYIQYHCTSLLMVFFVMLLYGIIFQSVITGCNLYLSEQYENGILYTKYLTAVRLIFYLVPLYVSQIIINPYSETATILSKNGEYFFGSHIVQNFVTFIFFYGLISSIVISLGYFCLKNTNQFRNRISPFVNSLMGRSQFRYNMDKEEVRIIQSISLNHQSMKFTNNFKSFIQQRNSSLIDKLSTLKSMKSELNPEKEEQYNKEGVLIISIIFFVLLTVYTYSNGMYKYISIVFKMQESQINLYYSLSTIFNVVGNFMAPYFWQNYPVLYSILFMFCCNFLNLFVILSSQFNPSNFLYSIWIGRFQSGFQPMLSDLVCFGLFEPMIAMEKIQLFAYGNLFANILGTIMNFVLFSEKHWTLIFYVSLFMVIGAGVYLFINIKTINRITKKELDQLICLLNLEVYNVQQYQI